MLVTHSDFIHKNILWGEKIVSHSHAITIQQYYNFNGISLVTVLTIQSHILMISRYCNLRISIYKPRHSANNIIAHSQVNTIQENLNFTI